MGVSQKDTVTAAVLLIGDELLSGRTKDKNLGYIAEYLNAMAVEVREARVVPDIQEEIVAALNAMRTRYDYVLTTGGIGPTHDDITADAVAAAFGVGIGYHPDAVAILEERYKDTELELNEARMRMARVPDGGELILNPVSGAPAFRVDNVFVMAGVPKIMQAMLENVAPLLDTGKAMLSRTVKVHIGEGDLAGPLEEIQQRFPDVSIGSYPFEDNGRFASNIVVRSKDQAAVDAAASAVEEMADQLKTQPNVRVWT